jgi:hypothetical protein
MNQHTKDKNDPSSSHTSPHHYNDAPDLISNTRTQYTILAAHLSHTQKHPSYRTPPTQAHLHWYANSNKITHSLFRLALREHALALLSSLKLSNFSFFPQFSLQYESFATIQTTSRDHLYRHTKSELKWVQLQHFSNWVQAVIGILASLRCSVTTGVNTGIVHNLVYIFYQFRHTH